MKMALPTAPRAVPATADKLGQEILGRLGEVCVDSGLESLAGRLAELSALVGDDLADLEDAIDALPRRPERVGQAARHLIDAGGKRLRPLCVLLAARLGRADAEVVRDLAIAVELVHDATLLHDDVVDLGEARRGLSTARRIYGNAASIFAGDWLLIEALRRVTRAGLPGLLDNLYDTIEEMIFAESLQLENRGRLDLTRGDYLRVCEGKTASVFRWAMRAGATAGGLPPSAIEAVERFGIDLGVAFQAIDDVLDLTGDAATTGKDLFTDLREGKMTFPIIVGLERSAALHDHLAVALAVDEDAPLDPSVWADIVGELRATGAVEAAIELAEQRSRRAVAELEALPAGPARRALETVAEGLVHRSF